jgi:hypothetical protein
MASVRQDLIHMLRPTYCNVSPRRTQCIEKLPTSLLPLGTAALGPSPSLSHHIFLPNIRFSLHISFPFTSLFSSSTVLCFFSFIFFYFLLLPSSLSFFFFFLLFSFPFLQTCSYQLPFPRLQLYFLFFFCFYVGSVLTLPVKSFP